MADQTFTDPLGRPITLHEHTWHGHILKGHKNMRRFRTEAQRTLTQPDRILFSYAPDARLYVSAPDTSGMMVVVVVDLKLGLVKTAYRAKKTKGGQEWP